MKQVEGLLAAILNTAIDSIIVIDQHGLIESINPATEQLFGYTAEEIVGRNITILMPSPYRDEHDQYLSNYQATGVRKIIGIGREVQGQRKDGSIFPMHLAVSQFELEGQTFFTGIIRDITEQKHAQQQLARMNELLEQRVRERTEQLRAAQADLLRSEKLATLGQVSGGIAHEIRNPLNAVKTSAYYLLNAKTPSEEKTREHLQRIDRQVTLIDNVITALSDVARLPEPHAMAFQLTEIIATVMSGGLDASAVTLENNLADNLPRVWGDPHQIAIVFRNLIRNARDAIHQTGTITVTAEPAGEYLVVEVTDTGTGIAAEHLEQVTEPLYSTKARGMGLGLAISKTILNRNHGELRVRSEVGTGTTFSVLLPIHHGQPLAARRANQVDYQEGKPT